jgi:hypothetical protein
METVIDETRNARKHLEQAARIEWRTSAPRVCTFGLVDTVLVQTLEKTGALP